MFTPFPMWTRPGHRQAWTEVQVVEGRRVVARFDFVEQAERWIAEQQSRPA